MVTGSEAGDELLADVSLAKTKNCFEAQRILLSWLEQGCTTGASQLPVTYTYGVEEKRRRIGSEDSFFIVLLNQGTIE